MFQIENPVVPLLVAFAILLPLLSFISFLFGRKIGRECKCCGFDMDCRYCVAAQCPTIKHR